MRKLTSTKKSKIFNWQNGETQQFDLNAAMPIVMPTVDGTSQDRVRAVKISQDRIAQAAKGLPAFDQTKTARQQSAGAATPQTLAKLKKDVCLKLLGKGILENEHLIAIEELREVAEAFMLSGGTPSWARDRVDGGKGFQDPLEQMSPAVRRMWRLSYRPWLLDLVQDPIRRETRYETHIYVGVPGFVRAICVDNIGLNSAEKGLRLPRDKGIGGLLLRFALDRYLMFSHNGKKTAEFCGLEKRAC